MSDRPEAMPALIPALVVSAPEGGLSYIGVVTLEDVAELATQRGIPDLTMDMLVAAELDASVTFEILSGPYPEYLDRWDIRDRFSTTFSPAQIDALYDWTNRRGHRLVIEGDRVGFAAQSAWFAS
jgi:hypothetical protein